MKLNLMQDCVCMHLRVPQKAEYIELLQLARDRRPLIWFFLPMVGRSEL